MDRPHRAVACLQTSQAHAKINRKADQHTREQNNQQTTKRPSQHNNIKKNNVPGSWNNVPGSWNIVAGRSRHNQKTITQKSKDNRQELKGNRRPGKDFQKTIKHNPHNINKKDQHTIKIETTDKHKATTQSKDNHTIKRQSRTTAKYCHSKQTITY